MAEQGKTGLPSSFVRVGEALPVDVYHKSGILLLKKGHFVLSPEQRSVLVNAGQGDAAEVAALLEQDRERRELAERTRQRQREAESRPPNPLSEFAFLLRRGEGLLQHGLALPGLGQALQALTNSIIALAHQQPDGALAALLLVPGQHPAADHAVRVALLLALLGRRLELDETRLHSLCAAGLTMNIAITPLLARLEGRVDQMTPWQQEEMLTHPLTGSAMLREAGIDDELWHLLVQTHHEQCDGSGFPQGLHGDEVPALASLIALADRYDERVSVGQQLPAQVLGALFRGGEAGVDPAQVSLLVRELGIYPPGSSVRLASGELAVVTQRTGRANAPKVAALRKQDGPPYVQPLLRETRQSAWQVVEAVAAAELRVKPGFLLPLWQR
ncbi:HD-GYP domain-containing protein [Chitinilyticum piscinae]|uniref:Phosphohydrolase n=1 Tax=Chitinilyticum piscinae TaxID=2866724 RepID=A0A8J7FZV5_9NEIS|nr:HD domain-containing phosphohydrolase [Chitinilyticum piscinae]MBE9608768.1 phosphohydrolase [Chitinilyticum piscinae]